MFCGCGTALHVMYQSHVFTCVVGLLAKSQAGCVEHQQAGKLARTVEDRSYAVNCLPHRSFAPCTASEGGYLTMRQLSANEYKLGL